MKQQYVERFGNAYQCSSPRAQQLWRLFKRECDRLGILYKMEGIVQGYRRGYGSTQLALF